MNSNENSAHKTSSTVSGGSGSMDTSLLKLLVVDNEAAHARAMMESLEKVGYQCEVATSGPEAAKLIGPSRPVRMEAQYVAPPVRGSDLGGLNNSINRGFGVGIGRAFGADANLMH